MNGRLTETVRDRHAVVTGTTRPRRPPPFHGEHTTTTRPPLRRRRGPAALGAVESVGPDEPVQQSARVRARLLVVDGDDDDLEDGAGEAGVHGRTGEAGPTINPLDLKGSTEPDRTGLASHPPSRALPDGGCGRMRPITPSAFHDVLGVMG